MNRFRVHIAWEPGRGGGDDGAARLARALGEIRTLLPAVGPWEATQANGTRAPRESSDAWRDALRAGLDEFDLYGFATVKLARAGARVFDYDEVRARLTATFGVEIDGDETIWIPNHVDLVMDPTPAMSRSILDTILVILVRTFDPLWGFVGSELAPQLRHDSDGEPVTGWLTYLSQAYGRATDLPGRASVRVIDRRGRLYRACDELFDQDDDDRLASVDELERALTGAGVLRPFHQVLADPRHLDAGEMLDVVAPTATPGVPARVDVAMPVPARVEVVLPDSFEPVAAMAGTQPVGVGSAAQPVLPFFGRRGAPPRVGDPLEPFAAMGETAPLARSKTRKPATPFEPDGDDGVERYARLCAELDSAGADRAEILARHGFASAEQFDELSELYRRAFSSDEELRARWAGRLIFHRERLSRLR